MMHILYALGLTVIMDLLIQRSGNGVISNRCTNPEGRSVGYKVDLPDVWLQLG